MNEEEKIERSATGPSGQTIGDPQGPAGRQQPEEIIAADEIVMPETEIQETENTKPKTDQMEVHHHPQLHHKPKPWKEYFLEFIMIFLAVTLGFFAESFREHLVENKKEKEIISALFSDLEKDTANLNNIIYRYMPEHSSREDSAAFYIDNLPIKENERKITLALINATNWNFYSPPQVSLEILKNAGTFNLVKDEHIKAEIVNFNGLINTYSNYSQFTLAAEHAIDTATAGIIRRAPLRSIINMVYNKTNAQYGSITDSDLPPGSLLKTYNKDRFLNFIVKMDAMDYLLHDLLGLYQQILKQEIILLDALQKEYHLE
jgi:hypothetical protein